MIDCALYSLLILLGAALLSANIAARCVSASVNFSVNRRFVFQDKGSLAESATQYAALALGILICNSAILFLLTSGLGLNPLPAKLLTEAILFLFSYLAQKKIIFFGAIHDWGVNDCEKPVERQTPPKTTRFSLSTGTITAQETAVTLSVTERSTVTARRAAKSLRFSRTALSKSQTTGK